MSSIIVGRTVLAVQTVSAVWHAVLRVRERELCFAVHMMSDRKLQLHNAKVDVLSSFLRLCGLS